MEVCAKNGCTLPVYVEPRTHISHKYCGRTHAMEVEGQRLQPPHGICHTCNLSGCKRPVAFVAATGRVHDFCSKAHADTAIRSGQWPSPQRSWSTKAAKFSSSGSSCCLPGCPLAVYSDGSSKIYDYCGRTHAIEHKQRKAERAFAGPTTSSSLSSRTFSFGSSAGIAVSSPNGEPTSSDAESKVGAQSSTRPVCSCCQEHNADIVLLPCGHICLCEADADKMFGSSTFSDCPCCKQNVTSRSKVYFNF